jgi:alkanesulfonate monooxygenase SsuD/methylene tetrahydromethanopterin reductase-like flavin-dependent oxidoreductase (luciferase family)
MIAADQAGFYELWLAEHNGRDYGMIGNVVTVAAAVAARTKRIRIATAVSRLPLHHPLHLAQDLAWVDVISRGRMDFGVGKGYDRLEFGTYGISFEEREARWEETFEAVQQIWATESTEFHGTFYELEAGALVPAPLQRPAIPTFVMVSGSERSIKFAADRLLPIASGSGPSPEQLRDRLNMYAEIASAAGHGDDKIGAVLDQCWQLKPLHVSVTTEKAIAEYQRGLEWYMGARGNRSQFGFSVDMKPYSYYVEHQAVLLGSPEKVAEDLADYCERSGVNNVICWPNMGGQPNAQVLECLRRMGEDVIPQVKDVRYRWQGSSTRPDTGVSAVPAAR